ncbi:unnamed protein product [Oppiella nova]|uniref:CCDC92/74 N-terminal domain-containing protein n=1 Tax=Oppiella nova TaxID=334625 RepID=A0A7R9LJJ7_9ACAR|nr:unnamed protein product [Oppiella nova]CAG2164259.1 unnamed protein product [Oppiella nova]
MESASNVLNSYPLPHQQFSSRIAFANDSKADNAINKLRFKSLANKKITSRLPPIARYDSPYVHNQFASQSFSQSVDSIDSCDASDKNLNTNGLDPILRIKQLEGNLKFVKEDCQHILESLHKELQELKVQNRDLQFELIMKGSVSPQMPQSVSKEDIILMPFIRGSLKPDVRKHIKSLENEVKRLRYALGETLKMNAMLKSQLQDLNTSAHERQTEKEFTSNWLPSPTVSEFHKTFAEIYSTEDSHLNQNESTISLPRIISNRFK